MASDWRCTNCGEHSPSVARLTADVERLTLDSCVDCGSPVLICDHAAKNLLDPERSFHAGQIEEMTTERDALAAQVAALREAGDLLDAALTNSAAIIRALAAAPEAHDTETRVMSWVDDLLRAGGDDAVAFWHGYVSAEAEDPLAQLREQLAAAQARETKLRDALTLVITAYDNQFDGSREWDWWGHMEVAITTARAALASAPEARDA